MPLDNSIGAVDLPYDYYDSYNYDNYDASGIGSVLPEPESGSDDYSSTLANLVNDYSSSLTSLVTSVLTDEVEATDDPSTNYTAVAGANIQFNLYDYLVPPIGVIALLLNLAVVVSSGLILKGGAHPRTTYLFLGNVAMADLVTTVAVLFGQFFPREKRSETLCIVSMGMIVSSTLASIWSVLLIGIDRFFYIAHALRYQQLLTPFRARFLILGTWILGLVLGFMPAMGWIGWTNGGKYCWFIRLAPHGLVLLTGAVGCLPIIIITVLYSIILYYAIHKVAQLQRADHEASMKERPKGNAKQLRIFRGGQSNENNQQDKTRHAPKKFRAVMVVALTTGSFIVTWIPFFIASTMHVFCEKTATDEETCKPLRIAVASPLAILGFFNSLLNPLIYAWWHKGFRKFVCSKICRRNGRQEAAGSRLTRSIKSSTSNTSTRTITGSTKGASNDVKPTGRKRSTGVTEGPYISENEDTRL
ncbi:glucose-dependent insulinotropic receptor-like [Periplaneta americana]|uniref:glucose-dependent insulinotropic receptor-like n=1 Tax=Periplaneta americana TaxID=6978 RepID=UPI0037E792B0